MNQEAQYIFKATPWQKYGKTRIYLTGECTNLDRVDANVRRAHARGYDYGYLALDINSDGRVEDWSLEAAKHDIERSPIVSTGSNFSLWAERLIEAQGFVFAAEFEKEVA